MIKRILSLMITLLFVQMATAQIDRSTAPEPAPAPKIQLGDYEQFTLDNGLQVIVVENHKIPRISWQIYVDADPALEGKFVGASEMAGGLLRSGTSNRSKAEIDEAVDFIGASLEPSSNGIYAASLTKHTDKLLDLVSDVLLNPTFPEAELEKVRKQTLSGLASSKEEPDAIARNVSNVLLYGDKHPYGEITTEATVEGITQEQAKAFYNTYFKPNVSYLVVVGDITPADAKKMANKYLGSWKRGDVPTHAYDMPKVPEATEVAFVDKTGAVQSVINIGYPIDLKPGSDDVIKVSLMNSILGGGGFGTRLFQNLREDKGYTYGAYSSLRSDKLVGMFGAQASVRNEVTDSSVVEFMKELNKIRDEKVGEDELMRAKKQRIGSFARAMERPQTIARFALNTARFNLPKDYYATYLEKVDKVTVADIQAMAKKYIKPENAHILIVGNKDDVAEKLALFSKSKAVNFYDNYGNPVKESTAVVPTNLGAQDVIDAYIKAIGGVDAVNKVKSIKQEMGMEMPGAPAPLTMMTYQKDNSKSMQEVGMNGMIVQKTVFDGVKGKQSGMQGNKELSAEEIEESKVNAYTFPEANYDVLGYKAVLKGVEAVDGKDAYKIQLESPSGKKTIDYYDIESGLKVKSVGTQEAQGQTVTVNVMYNDYKAVDGIQFPHEIKQVFGPQTIKMTVKSIEINGEMNDDIFKVE